MNEMNWAIQQGDALPIKLADPRFDFLKQIFILFDTFPRRDADKDETDVIDFLPFREEVIDCLQSMENPFRVIHPFDGNNQACPCMSLAKCVATLPEFFRIHGFLKLRGVDANWIDT